MKYKVLVDNLIKLSKKINYHNDCQIKHLGRFAAIYSQEKQSKGFTQSLLDYLEIREDAKIWALENEIIKGEAKYKVGQIYFRHNHYAEDDKYWIIAHVWDKQVTMINMTTGNLWTNPLEVVKLDDISDEEFAKITSKHNEKVYLDLSLVKEAHIISNPF